MSIGKAAISVVSEHDGDRLVSLAISIVGWLPEANPANRQHHMTLWREGQRIRKTMLRVAGPAVRGPGLPWERAAILCVRHSTKQPDRANLAYSFKQLIDSLLPSEWRTSKRGRRLYQRVGLISDDSPVVLLREEYEWREAARADSGVTMRIESV